jgi:ATP-dependent protease ClpP protease subunit
MNIKTIRETTAEELLKKRVIRVEGDLINMAPEFIENSLLTLDSKSKKAIYLYFWSEGGDCDLGHLLYDLLRSIKSPTIGIVGFAGSAANIILQGCSDRLIFKSGKILIHTPAITMRDYKLNEYFDERVRRAREKGMLAKKRTEEIYLERSRVSPEQLAELNRRGDMFNEWIYAQRAKKMGFVDRIIEYDYKLFD